MLLLPFLLASDSMKSRAVRVDFGKKMPHFRGVHRRREFEASLTDDPRDRSTDVLANLKSHAYFFFVDFLPDFFEDLDFVPPPPISTSIVLLRVPPEILGRHRSRVDLFN